MSPELLLVVILLMGIFAIATLGNEVERHSVRSAQALGLLIIAAGIGVNWLFHNALSPQLSLALLASLLVAAPLLDRTRAMSLVLAATLIGVVLVHFQAEIFAQLPKAPAAIATLMLLAVASLIGLLGSAWIPMRNPRDKHGVSALLGRVALVALLLILLAPISLTNALISGALSSGICGAFALHRSYAQPLRVMGMGLVAGVILTQSGVPQWQVAVTSLVGAYVVFAGIRSTRALLVDDPHNITGSIFLPALLAILIYGAQHHLASSLQWVGAVIGLGIAGSLLWPVVRFFFGLHATARQWREGMDSRLGH